MSNQESLSFRICSIHPSAVDASLPPIPSAVVLTVDPGAIKQAGVETPRELAALLQKEARAHQINGIRLNDKITLGQASLLDDEMAKFTDTFNLAVTVAFETGSGRSIKAPRAQSAIKLIEWIHLAGDIGSLTQSLKVFSKAGIWNHVRMPAEKDRNLMEPFIRFAVANPNIVHSWEIIESEHSSFSDSSNLTDALISTSSRYSPLPGRPFWQCLPDLVHLLLYLNEYGLQKVRRWWVPTEGHAMFTLGENLANHFVRPQALSPKRLDEICRMVEAGGSVGTKWVRYNLERAFLIAYVTEMNVVVANSSLKHPRPEYIAALNEQTGIDFSGYLERGYTSVRPEYRGMGIGTRLLDGLTSRAGERKLFSLIGEENIATQEIALRNRTRKVSTFFSRRTGKQMGVWIPEAVLDTTKRSTL